MSDIFDFIILPLGMFVVGILLGGAFFYSVGENQVPQNCDTQVRIAGLWLPDISYLANYSGRWICINLDGNKNLTDVERTCRHEVGHEIFAKYCESNWTQCEEITQ